MKSSKSEIAYFILTIMVLAAGGFLYVFFGNRHQLTVDFPTQLTANKPSQEEKKTDDRPEDVRLAQEHLTKLDNALSPENLETAQAAIDAVTKPEAKEALQNQLNALAAEFETQVKAEELVAQAEAYLSYPALEAAQEVVNSVTKETKKAELQARLNTVKANLDAYSQANAGYTG